MPWKTFPTLACLCFVFSSIFTHAGINLQPNGTIYQTYLTNLPPINRLNGELGLYREYSDTRIFIQAQSHADNHTIVTADPFDSLKVWFYANSFLGYIDPASGTLLHVEKVQAFGQEQPIVNAYQRFGTYQIDESWVYPGTTQKIRNADFVLFNPDGSVLRAESGQYIYRQSGRELNFRARHYDDREDYFHWHDGGYINHPVTKHRFYDNGNVMIGPTQDPRVTPPSRPAWYEDGKQFYLSEPLYPNGDRMTAGMPGTYNLFFPSPNNLIKLIDARAGGFIQIRYPHNDVAKQDIAPYFGQLRRTDGNFTTQIAQSYSFPDNVTVNIAANETGDFVGIYRDQTNSVAAVVHARMPPMNQRNIRVAEVTDTQMKLKLEPTVGDYPSYQVHVRKGKDFLSPYDSNGEIFLTTSLSPVVENLEPDTSYIVEVSDQFTSGFSNEPFFVVTSKLYNVSTRTRLQFSNNPVPKVSITSNSPGERYRLEKSTDLANWSIAGGTQTSPGTTPALLEWKLPETAGTQWFYRVRKITPFEWE